MYSISFHHNVFITTTIICMITLTSVSTSELYQMVKNKNESYFTYMSTTTPSKSNEKKMSIEEFYQTIHNLKYKKIPAPYGKYDYKVYLDEITKYCDEEYVTMELFERNYQVEHFKAALLNLNSCISEFLKTDQERKTMIDALESPPTFDVGAHEYLSTMKGNIDCYHRVYKNGVVKNLILVDGVYVVENLSFVDCFSYRMDERYGSSKYADFLMKKINHKEEINSCIVSFRDTFTDILSDKKNKKLSKSKSCGIGSCVGIGEKKRATLDEIHLVLGLTYHHNSDFNSINAHTLFRYYAKVDRISMYPSHASVCKLDIDKMDSVTYTATKLSYMVIPVLSEHKSHDIYKKRRNKIIDYLLNFDKNNSQYYQALKDYTENMTEGLFKNMIKRRAMLNEDYISYAMRMNVRGFLPLPEELWKNEQANSNLSDIQNITEKELTEDLQVIFREKNLK